MIYNAKVVKSLSHSGRGGSSPGDRLRPYGNFGSLGENILYNYAAEGDNVNMRAALQFYIDDGVKSRGHRVNMVNGAYTMTGIGIVNEGRRLYVGQIFAGSFTDSNMKLSSSQLNANGMAAYMKAGGKPAVSPKQPA